MTGQGAATVLVFAGLDPSGGAGIAADITAIAALGAHALPIVTALTVQDHERVHAVEPVDAVLLARQAQALMAVTRIDAVKIGIPGNRANAEAIAAIITMLRARQPQLPVVLDPVLASGHGDALARGDARAALAPLLALASVATPNLGEAAALDLAACRHVLVTGGHGEGADVINRCGHWSWRWPRLPGAFHGSGCTLAAAIAACLARGDTLEAALGTAQEYVHQSLATAFSIGPGQSIPRRFLSTFTR
ncbi:bifunctional hydroxymethylpyrimidine kinase/phosphomethylpyrimidine kinase [Massilia sp. PAMC28688]|uniref:bifunctional hydroxymethylpyrimidine kinase/phosphomethylpyrimidine kinase n=1 Tax=Massilia sp. PAMC28688 TaxID=2861283 RepID=UPI001C6321B0|nr:bifunctional hydroxymethylpyrimidine kinase/phosphomethylpyrimidine kinase [Massilia sp. PAMC28688]QYF94482.1 bifunctional hydroxymethylpyrimidine kinase/phosphomethylpyrimidine kinase [Massilia sp. PAMC28688]